MAKIPTYCLTKEENDSELVNINDHYLNNIGGLELRPKLEILLTLNEMDSFLEFRWKY